MAILARTPRVSSAAFTRRYAPSPPLATPPLPVSPGFFSTLDQVHRSLTTERLLAALSGSFGALALLLSLIGLYGVMSFVVTRRTREIGIRLALGATGASAIRLVLRDAGAIRMIPRTEHSGPVLEIETADYL